MSKKILFSIIISIILLGSVLFILNKRRLAVNYQNLDLVASKTETKIYKDTDGDGLKDWEEDLWKTNLEDPDTDKDGTIDFEEIREGRDPLLKGPNDKLDLKTIQDKINPSLESDLTATEKFSRELFAKYVNAKQNGDIKNGGYEELLLQYAEQSNKEDVVIYKETDLKKIDPGEQNIKTYGNNFAKIIKEKNKKYPKNELALLDEIIKENPGTQERFEEFKEISNRYSEIKEEMLKMEVPENALKIHTQIINLLGMISISVENMQYTFSDPIKSLTWVSTYPHAVDLLLKTLVDLKDYFLSNKIIFNSYEDGSMFTKGV